MGAATAGRLASVPPTTIALPAPTTLSMTSLPRASCAPPGSPSATAAPTGARRPAASRRRRKARSASRASRRASHAVLAKPARSAARRRPSPRRGGAGPRQLARGDLDGPARVGGAGHDGEAALGRQVDQAGLADGDLVALDQRVAALGDRATVDEGAVPAAGVDEEE